MIVLACLGLFTACERRIDEYSEKNHRQPLVDLILLSLDDRILASEPAIRATMQDCVASFGFEESDVTVTEDRIGLECGDTFTASFLTFGLSDGSFWLVEVGRDGRSDIDGGLLEEAVREARESGETGGIEGYGLSGGPLWRSLHPKLLDVSGDDTIFGFETGSDGSRVTLFHSRPTVRARLAKPE